MGYIIFNKNCPNAQWTYIPILVPNRVELQRICYNLTGNWFKGTMILYIGKFTSLPDEKVPILDYIEATYHTSVGWLNPQYTSNFNSILLDGNLTLYVYNAMAGAIKIGITIWYK